MLLSKFCNKMFGDRMQVGYALKWHYTFSSSTNNYVLNQSKPLLHACKPVILRGSACNYLLDKINNSFKKLIDSMCTKFYSINKTLIVATEVSKLFNVCQ